MPEATSGTGGRRRHGTGSTYEFRFGYSRAVRHGNVIRIAGTAGLGEDGNVVSDDVAEQTRRALEIVEESLAALGGKLSDVVMTRVYVSDTSDIERVAVIHGEAFRDIRPASSIVKVGFIDPRILVEIEAEAVCGGTEAGR
ncbi:MAG: RidA family protein [Chloroflexota bacterium]|nr:RidA family protein [Chloroflexota bacterium]MDE3192941.1 RidA family protein [Chloroflexota bacterium]